MLLTRSKGIIVRFSVVFIFTYNYAKLAPYTDLGENETCTFTLFRGLKCKFQKINCSLNTHVHVFKVMLGIQAVLSFGARQNSQIPPYSSALGRSGGVG